MLALLLIFQNENLSSQRKIYPIEMEAGITVSDNYEKAFCYYSADYFWQINRYLKFSTGGMLGMGELNTSWRADNKDYSIDEPKYYKLLSVSGVNLAIPLLYNLGISTDLKFLFEPVPLDYISLNTWINETNDFHGTYKLYWFNPGYRADAAIFRDFKKDNNGFRLSLGVGYGYYDLYRSFRNVTIDNQQLGPHIPANKPIFSIFIRVSGL